MFSTRTRVENKQKHKLFCVQLPALFSSSSSGEVSFSSNTVSTSNTHSRRLASSTFLNHMTKSQSGSPTWTLSTSRQNLQVQHLKVPPPFLSFRGLHGRCSYWALQSGGNTPGPASPRTPPPTEHPPRAGERRRLPVQQHP